MLNQNPEQLVLKYIPVVESMVIKKLIIPGYFHYQDKEDKVQEIIEGLLNDIEKIRKNYNYHSSFRPYFIQIINNRCGEIRRKAYRQRSIKTLQEDPDNPAYEKKIFYLKKDDYQEFTDINLSDTSNDPDSELIISSELDNLDKIFRLYPIQKPKIIICLKFILGFPISLKELTAYSEYCKKRYYDSIIELSNSYDNQTLEEQYQILTDFFNHCDHTKKQKDALRKWLTKVISEIIQLLNKDANTPVYNKQNIMGLIGFYFDKSRFNNS